MPLLMGLCDRMYALEAGRVIAAGTPDEIRHNPRVVASYLGTEEMAITRSGTSARPAAAGKESPLSVVVQFEPADFCVSQLRTAEGPVRSALWHTLLRLCRVA